MSICYDCVKAPAETPTPCDGSVISLYDISTGVTTDVRPIITAGTGGTYTYTFDFNKISHTIYSSDGGTSWIFIRNDTQQKYGYSNTASAPCPATIGWNPTYIGKWFVVGITSNVIPQPGEPTAATCSPSINVPNTVNSKELATVLDSFNSCFITKGTTYYNKISGGVPCDSRELSKMKLILRLLNEKDCTGRALECMYNHTAFPSAVYTKYRTSVIIRNSATPGVYELKGVSTTDDDISRYAGFTINVPKGVLPAHSFTIKSATYNVAADLTKITISPDYGYTYTGGIQVTLSYSTTETAYLDSFINFANKFCADCITTPATPLTSTKQPGKGPETTSIATTEDLLRYEGSGFEVELESLQTINLN